MECLIQQFQTVGFQPAPPAPFYVIPYNKGVYANQTFQKGDCLGEIQGVLRNIYEVPHSDYLCFREELVIDFRRDAQCQYYIPTSNPLWYMVENEDTPECPNVALHRDDEGRIWAFATRTIWAGNELIYNMADTTDELESWSGEDAEGSGEDAADAEMECD